MTLLEELLTEAVNHQMAADTIFAASKSLSIAFRQAIENLQEALEWNDPGQMLPSVAPVTKWLNANYHTSKRGTGGYGVQSSLSKLSETKAFRELAAEAMASVKENADRNAPNRISKSKQVMGLAHGMAGILRKLPSTHLGDGSNAKMYERVATDLVARSNKYHQLLSQLSKIKMSDRGIDPKADEKAAAVTREKKEQKQSRGSQAQQAEQLVSQVLSTLPKDQAAQIRPIVMKADNKLLALQDEMKKRGLS